MTEKSVITTEEANNVDVNSDEELLTEGDLAADYLEELLDIADLDGDIENYVANERAQVSIDTDNDILVGKNGEVLEALQELCRLTLMRKTGIKSRLMLDIADYRKKRKLEVEKIAKDVVAEVGQTGEEIRLVPMNAFERKIVHDVVAAAGFKSESEGLKSSRRVVVFPK